MSHTAMSARLAGKTILVTGASSGIGRSVAIEFSRTSPDIKLILAARREENLKELAKLLESESGGKTKVLPFKLDVSSLSEVNGFVDRLPKEWRDIDILVNNAYDFPLERDVCVWANLIFSGLVKGVDKVGEIAEDDINIMLSTNVTGLINVAGSLSSRAEYLLTHQPDDPKDSSHFSCSWWTRRCNQCWIYRW